MTPQVSADAEPRAEPNPALKERVYATARILAGRKLALAKLSAEVKATAEAIRIIEERDLPAALRDAGMTRADLGKGWSVSIEKFASGSLTEENAEAACDWAEAHGFAAIVKHAVTAWFGKGEEKAYAKFVRDLGKRKKPIEVETKRTIHGTTLSKFVAKQIAAEDAGEVPPERKLPRELFSVYAGTKAVLKGPETKKGKQ